MCFTYAKTHTTWDRRRGVEAKERAAPPIITGLRAATRQWWGLLHWASSPYGCHWESMRSRPVAGQRPIRTHAPKNRLRRRSDDCSSASSCVGGRIPTSHPTNNARQRTIFPPSHQAQSKQGERSALPLIERRPSQAKQVRGYLRREPRQASIRATPSSQSPWYVRSR